MNILVVDDEEDIREILGFALEAEVEADCTFVKSGNEAWEKIESKDSFDLIICDYNMPDGNGGDLYRHLLDNEIAIPFVLCSSISAIEKSDFDNKSYLIGQIEKPFIYEGVLSTLEKFNVVKEGFPDDIESVIRNQSKYISVDFNLIEKLKTTPCNIFLKLNKDKHIKIFNKKIKIYQSDLSKYKDDQRYLCIEREDISSFMNGIIKEVESVFDDEKLEDPRKVLSAMDIILKTIRSLGFSDDALKVTKRSVSLMLQSFENASELDNIYKALFQDSEAYLTKHSIAMAYISCSILSKTRWDSPETRLKLVMASFLHDISLESFEMDERKPNLNAIQKEAYDKHSHAGADFVAKIDELPGDIDAIIRDHHEKPDGSGFPRGLSSSGLKPMPSLFIFAHEVSDILLTLKEDDEYLTKTNVLNRLNTGLYNSGHFKKCLNALNETSLFLKG